MSSLVATHTRRRRVRQQTAATALTVALRRIEKESH
jgi:hypothetical protein